MLGKLVLLSVDASELNAETAIVHGNKGPAGASAVAVDLQVLLQLHKCQQVRIRALLDISWLHNQASRLIITVATIKG